MLAVQRAKYLEKHRHGISADDIRVYFESVSAQLTSIRSTFQKNADKTRVGSAKHRSPPDVIVASGTKPGSVTIPEIRDDAQLTLLTAVSAFGVSTHLHFISKKKTFEKQLMGLNSRSRAIIRTSPKPFITETLFIDWIEMMFLVRSDYLRQKFAYEGP
jgi:hypothetical protein